MSTKHSAVANPLLARVLLPALRSGAALSLAAVLGEFGVSLVLWRPEWTTLTLAIYERLGRPGALPYEEALAIALLLVFS